MGQSAGCALGCYCCSSREPDKQETADGLVSPRAPQKLSSKRIATPPLSPRSAREDRERFSQQGLESDAELAEAHRLAGIEAEKAEAERIAVEEAERLAAAQAWQDFLEAEKVEADRKLKIYPPIVVTEALTVEETGLNTWVLKETEDKAMKLGLRLLQSAWEAHPFSESKGWQRAMKRKLLEDIGNGCRELKAVPRSDVSAAQPDVKHMPINLLLNIKVRHQDVQMLSLSESHASFLKAVDDSLFPQLGELVLGTGAARSMDPLGRQAVLLLAASTAIEEVKQWVWCIPDGRRMFFNAQRFICVEDWPVGGALEYTDNTRSDASSALGGRAKFMHWSIKLSVPEGAEADNLRRQRELRFAAVKQQEQEEAERLAAAVGPAIEPNEFLGAEEKAAGRWLLKDVTELKAMSLGIRLLQKAWVGFPFETSRGWQRSMRRKLLEDIAIGDRDLRSVPRNELSAAQPDIKSMPLPFLLNIKAMFLEVNRESLGDAHASFLRRVDETLFTLLGQRAISGCIRWPAGVAGQALGHQAVLLLAASTAISSVKLWAWWVTDDRRIFFDARRFASSEVFPSNGVLEAIGTGKQTAIDPRQRWMQWQITYMSEMSKLSTVEEHKSRCVSAVDTITVDALSTAIIALKRIKRPSVVERERLERLSVMAKRVSEMSQVEDDE